MFVLTGDMLNCRFSLRNTTRAAAINATLVTAGNNATAEPYPSVEELEAMPLEDALAAAQGAFRVSLKYSYHGHVSKLTTFVLFARPPPVVPAAVVEANDTAAAGGGESVPPHIAGLTINELLRNVSSADALASVLSDDIPSERLEELREMIENGTFAAGDQDEPSFYHHDLRSYGDDQEDVDDLAWAARMYDGEGAAAGNRRLLQVQDSGSRDGKGVGAGVSEDDEDEGDAEDDEDSGEDSTPIRIVSGSSWAEGGVPDSGDMLPSKLEWFTQRGRSVKDVATAVTIAWRHALDAVSHMHAQRWFVEPHEPLHAALSAVDVSATATVAGAASPMDASPQLEGTPSLRAGRRRLLDAFGDSLVYTNKLINSVFKKSSVFCASVGRVLCRAPSFSCVFVCFAVSVRRAPRKAIAHMPHFIDRVAMESLQAKCVLAA